MGLPTSKSEGERFEELEFLKYRSLPESLLREDDIFYETTKTLIEEAFGACNPGGGHDVSQDDMEFFGKCNIRTVISCLDDLTNKGLYLLATIVAGDSGKFEKTRWKMKRLIKDHLPKVLGSRNPSHFEMDICRQLSKLLNDPQYFREKGGTFWNPRSRSQHAAVTKVLSGLNNLPSEILIAMYRRLKGAQAGLPQLLPRRHGWGRGYLIKQLRKTSEKMLSELGEGDELQEPLAKAMAVPGLLVKLKPGSHNSSGTEFYPFSSEIKSLQDEIAKAIWLLKTKVRLPELKNLQLLLDPNAKVSNRSLRAAIRRMLTKYLYECSEMDAIPKSLLETLSIINNNSRSTPLGCFSKDEVEKEIESILSVSAQTKQIVLDLLPGHDFDQDFADAYMEVLEESDDGGDEGDNNENSWHVEESSSQASRFHFIDSNYEGESTGESIPFNLKQVTSTPKENRSSSLLTPQKDFSHSFEGLEPMGCTGMHSVNPRGIISSSPFRESMSLSRMVNICMNQNKVEGIGGSLMPKVNGNYQSSVSANQSFDRCEPEHNSGLEPVSTPFISLKVSLGEQKAANDKQRSCKNQYLAIQELCDETSMIAYNLVGHLLDGFARAEGLELDWRESLYLRGGDSIEEDFQGGKEDKIPSEKCDGAAVVRVVEDLIPSFPKSGIERLRKLMGL